MDREQQEGRGSQWTRTTALPAPAGVPACRPATVVQPYRRCGAHPPDVQACCSAAGSGGMASRCSVEKKPVRRRGWGVSSVLPRVSTAWRTCIQGGARRVVVGWGSMSGWWMGLLAGGAVLALLHITALEHKQARQPLPAAPSTSCQQAVGGMQAAAGRQRPARRTPLCGRSGLTLMHRAAANSGSAAKRAAASAAPLKFGMRWCTAVETGT
jgi:hypothetical protein